MSLDLHKKNDVKFETPIYSLSFESYLLIEDLLEDFYKASGVRIDPYADTLMSVELQKSFLNILVKKHSPDTKDICCLITVLKLCIQENEDVIWIGD